MNERGFFTIVGLCLLMFAAISIKGVHEFEANYSGGITILKIEHELQNAADSALINALENDSTATQTFTSEKFGTIKVEIRREQNLNIKKFTRKYSSGSNYTDIDAGENPQPVTAIICVASCDNPFIDGKIYRRSFAYIDAENTIHFLNKL